MGAQGGLGGLAPEFIGREKLTELLLALLSTSGTVLRPWTRFAEWPGPGPITVSTLDPRSDGDFGGVEIGRMGVSTLRERRPIPLLGANCGGIAGSGGTLTGPAVVAGRRGDCSRKILEVIELELFARRRDAWLERLGTSACDSEARRLTILFVWISPTGDGAGERARMAVAAAAEDRLPDEG